MKRLIALLLCFTLLCAFVACSEVKTETDPEDVTETTETATEETETEENETEENETEENETEENETEENGTGGGSETPVTTTKNLGTENPATTTKAPTTTTKAQGGATTTTKAPTTTTKAPTTTTKAPTTTTKKLVTYFKNTQVNGRYEQGKVSAVLVEAYWENGTFVAKVALVNTTGTVQTGVYLKSLVIRGTNGQVVCDAGFTSQGQGFTIQNNQYIEHTYRMSGAAAPNQGTDIGVTSLSGVLDRI